MAAAARASEAPLDGGSSVTATSPPASETARSARRLGAGSGCQGRRVSATAGAPRARSSAAASGAR